MLKGEIIRYNVLIKYDSILRCLNNFIGNSKDINTAHKILN